MQIHLSIQSGVRRSSRKSRGDSSRRGTVAVEMALLMPFLSFLVLGICEVGQVQRAQCYVSEAAYAGCVAGSLPGGSNTKLISDVRNYLTACKMTAASAVITIKVNDAVNEVVSANRNDKITVTVTVPIAATSWFGSHCFVSANSTVQKTVVMLKQG